MPAMIRPVRNRRGFAGNGFATEQDRKDLYAPYRQNIPIMDLASFLMETPGYTCQHRKRSDSQACQWQPREK